MNILVCVKRIPAPGALIEITEDQQRINTRYLSFTISPHEECAVEEAVRQIEKHGGSSTVLTLGPEVATEQLREALALGIDEAMLLLTEDEEWGPMATARAIVDEIQARQEEPFDVLLFGNESADAGGYQVGIRVAHALNVPCVTGVKGLEIITETAIARRETAGGLESYEVPLPAVFTIKEGINLPRYPSLRGKLAAKKKAITRIEPEKRGDGLERVRLVTPDVTYRGAEILGEGPNAVPRVVSVMQELGLV